MSKPNTHTGKVCVRYFYLAASKERNAEVIQVLNSASGIITVPMREEDVELQSFFMRPMSKNEIDLYGGSQTWKLFGSWEELQQDHLSLKLPASLLQQLIQFQRHFELQEEMAA